MRKSKYQVDEGYFDFLDTPAKSYILGFLWADGHIRKDGYAVQVKVNKRELIIVHFILDQLKSTHPIKDRTEDRIEIVLGSKRLTSRLSDIGFSSNKTYSDTIPNYGQDVMAFILGLIDGDGSIHKDRRGQWNLQITNTRAMCEFVKAQLGGGGIYPDGSVWKYQVGGNLQLHRIASTLLGSNPKGLSTPNTRKRKKLQEILHGDDKNM